MVVVVVVVVVAAVAAVAVVVVAVELFEPEEANSRYLVVTHASMPSAHVPCLSPPGLHAAHLPGLVRHLHGDGQGRALEL